jgi:hypothetical protein
MLITPSPNGDGLLHGAGRRIPSGLIVLLLEVTADDERLIKVRRVLDNRLDDQPGFTVRLIGAVKVFGDHRLVAVWHTIPAKVSRFHFGSDYFDRAAHGRTPTAAASLRLLDAATSAATGPTAESLSTLSARAADHLP